MVLSITSFIIGWLIENKLPALPILITVFVLISGAITLIYQSPDILIISNSIYYLGFSLILLIGLFFRFNLLKYIFNKTFAITDTGWSILALRWAMMLGAVGISNEIIRWFYDEDVWIIYKLFTNLTLAFFALAQLTLSRKYRLAEFSNALGIRTRDDV